MTALAPHICSVAAILLIEREDGPVNIITSSPMSSTTSARNWTTTSTTKTTAKTTSMKTESNGGDGDDGRHNRRRHHDGGERRSGHGADGPARRRRGGVWPRPARKTQRAEQFPRASGSDGIRPSTGRAPSFWDQLDADDRHGDLGVVSGAGIWRAGRTAGACERRPELRTSRGRQRCFGLCTTPSRS